MPTKPHDKVTLLLIALLYIKQIVKIINGYISLYINIQGAGLAQYLTRDVTLHLDLKAAK